MSLRSHANKYTPDKGGCDNNKIQQRVLTIDDLDWLIPFGISFDNSFFPHFAAPPHQIEMSISNFITSLPKESIELVKQSLTSCFINISIVSQFTTQTKSSTSLLRILLNVEILQEFTILSLGQFFALTILEDNIQKLRSVTREIVRDLSFLTFVSNEKLLKDMIFESISVCHQCIKEILLPTLFLLINGNGEVVDRLLNLMLENNSLTCDILTAIEGFALNADDKGRVRKHILSNVLQSASTKDLPTVIRFLVSTTDDTNAASTVDAFRANLVVISRSSQMQIETLSLADTDFFVILQIKNALQFNQSFNKSFIAALEFSEGEFGTLDVWVIYCLFSISPMKTRAQQMIVKMSGKTLTSTSIANSIIGHKKAVEIISSHLIDLMSWMIGSAVESVARNGVSMASALFEEIDNVGLLQDIVGSLLIQIEIGEEVNKAKVVGIIELLSLEHPEKLRVFSQLIQGVLWVSDSIGANLYAKVAAVAARLTFRALIDVIEQSGNQMTIGFTKMMTSSHIEMKEFGVIGSAAIVNRINEISGDEMTYLVRAFNSVVDIIGDDPKLVQIFFKFIYRNNNRSKNFNEFLISKLENQFNELVIDDDEKGEFGLNKNFEINEYNECNENQTNHSKITLNLSLFLQSDANRMSFSARKQLEHRKITTILFTSYGIQLLLDAHQSIGHNIHSVCDHIFRASLILASEERTDEEIVTILLFAHSYLMQILNFFAINNKQLPEELCVERFIHIIKIEERIVLMLRDMESFEHPFYGEMFPKFKTFLKKYKESNDISSLFVEKYRSYFQPPSSIYFSLISILPIPYNDDHITIVLKIIIDYSYCLCAKNGSLYDVDFFESLNFVKYVCEKVLPSLLTDERSTSVLICERIFKFLKSEFALLQYKDKTQFQQLLVCCCGNEGRSNCFKKFARIISANKTLPQSVQLPMILFLRAVLHNGPNMKVDISGQESRYLCKLAKQLLTSSSSVLLKSGVQSVLPIFFEHNKRVINDVSLFITAVFPLDILSGNKCDLWPSLAPETFPLFFKECFSSLNMKLNEVKRKICSNIFIISEELISAVMNRLNKLAILAKGLLLHTCIEKVPASVLRITIKYGVSWLDTNTNLFSFLSDSRDFDTDSVYDFLNTCAAIARQLQSVVDHVRRNEKSLQSLLPAISKSLAAWTYALKGSLRTAHENVELEHAKERTLIGEIIKTQQIIDASQNQED